MLNDIASTFYSQFVIQTFWGVEKPAGRGIVTFFFIWAKFFCIYVFIFKIGVPLFFFSACCTSEVVSILIIIQIFHSSVCRIILYWKSLFANNLLGCYTFRRFLRNGCFRQKRFTRFYVVGVCLNKILLI